MMNREGFIYEHTSPDAATGKAREKQMPNWDTPQHPMEERRRGFSR